MDFDSPSKKASKMMLTTVAKRAAASAVRRPQHQQRLQKLSTAVPNASAPTGPPFKRYFMYTTAIMFGIPGAIGATFVHNLKTDDAFYSHFNDRYPELIAAINEYYSLEPESVLDLASRTDIGPVTPTSELLDESASYYKRPWWTKSYGYVCILTLWMCVCVLQ